ncbi:PRC-barrel domain-containing protein [Sporocytophaga myxococcoides]|uniref:PRC-barrel domain-containing protein n=1 Tax=Sporocytophaga myxococcoides TaxID=153721 RepID=UPI0004245F6B|nr:PRC-barrel domain-containing protein [Sporocytophaga myxococcoides]
MEDELEWRRNLVRFSSLKHSNLVDEEGFLGYEVINEKNESLGNVSDLIIDPIEGKTKFIDILTNKEFSHGGGERHLFIALNHCEFSKSNNKLFLRGIERDLLLKFPIVKGGIVTLDYEHTLREVLSPESALESTKTGYYKEITDEPGLFDPSLLAPNPDHYFSSPNP